MRESLPTALKLTFGSEGAYSNDKHDTGNWLNGQLVGTKYGITGKTLAAHRGVKHVTAADVKALSLDEAAEIYRKSYWAQSGGDLLPAGLDYAAFDFGVNSGPATAVKKLQKVVGVRQDGIVGVQTLAAVGRYAGGIEQLIRDYCDERMRYLRGLKTWSKHGRGWTRRVTGKDPKGILKDEPGVVGSAIMMAAGAKPAVPAPTDPAKANPTDRSVVDIVKDEPSLLVSLLSGLGAMAAGSGPLQWALAISIVAGVGYCIFRLVQRERANA